MSSGFKKISCFLIVVGSLVLNVACNKNDDNNNSTPAATPSPYGSYPYNQYPGNYGTWATTPQPCNYVNNGYYQPQMNGYGYNCNQYQGYYPSYGPGYQPNYYYGAWMWPTTFNPAAGYCGCPSGYTPTYGAYYGVSCAPNAYFNNWRVTWINVGAYWGSPQNSFGLSTPQVAYSSINPGCGQVAQGCDVRMNNCSAGYTCRPIGGGSTIGLCAL